MCLVIFDWGIGTVALYLLSHALDFLITLDHRGKWGVSLLMGTLLAARSPSSAIAIIQELHAQGPFTALVLGVTVLMDIIVILFFSMNLLVATALLTPQGTTNGAGSLFLRSMFQVFASVSAGLFLGRVVLPLSLWRWLQCVAWASGRKTTIGGQQEEDDGEREGESSGGKIDEWSRAVVPLQVGLFVTLIFSIFLLEPYTKEIIEPLVLCMVAGLHYI